MQFKDALAAIQELAGAHPALFDDVDINMTFGEGRPCIGDWSNLDNLGMLVTGDGIGNQSGVYFFASPDGEIIYIGKATKNNLHHRVWDHVKTPEVLADGRRTFPKHELHATAEVDRHASNVQKGKVRLGVVTISDPNLVSFVEVYLHTLHKKRFGRLPLFNKQVG